MFQTPPGKTKEMTSTEPTTELFSNEALLQLEERLGLTKTALAVSARLRLAELPVLAQRLEDIPEREPPRTARARTIAPSAIPSYPRSCGPAGSAGSVPPSRPSTPAAFSNLLQLCFGLGLSMYV